MQTSMVRRNCKQCGAEFEGYNNQRYCSLKCKEIYYAEHFDKERKAEIERASNERRKERQNEKKQLKYKGLSIGEISVLARQEGLTYGQYVQKYGM